MKVLASFDTPRAACTAAGRVILVDLEEGYQPLVTWWENTDTGGRIWGHYFAADQRKEAEADFLARTQRGY